MNRDEQVAEAYLAGLGLGKPDFEPDGNVPPDFLLQSRIAVEVRRLNKHSFGARKPQGLEQAEISLMETASDVFKEFDPMHDGSSFFVFLRFSRPLPSKKEIQKSMRHELRSFLAGRRERLSHRTISTSIEIDIIPTRTDHGRPFLISGNSDDERGGWLLEDMEKNIQHCSDEKQMKIALYRHNYPVLWLVLVDHIGYALDDFNRRNFKRYVTITHSWDKIVLVSPINSSHAYEI
jgi:hypothetical protein